MRLIISSILVAILFAVSVNCAAKNNDKKEVKVDLATPNQDSGFLSVQGTKAWTKRKGLGISGGIGGVNCVREFCDSTADTKFAGSLEGTVGMFYKIIPNLSFRGDLAFSRLNVNLARGGGESENEYGILFRFIVGTDFHLPIKGWLDTSLGFGVGPVVLSTKVEYEDRERKIVYKGFDMEIKLAVNVYPFSAAPTLAFGLYYKIGIPIWPKACIADFNRPEETCSDPDNLSNAINDSDDEHHFSEEPLFLHFGAAFKYGF